ncbi:MAG: hypothetical protein VB875_01705, partial [Pirellulales bacterium]
MDDQSQFNPYKPPEYISGDSAAGKLGPQIEFEPLPCPQCRGTDTQPSPYSAWHGRRATRPGQRQFQIQINAGTRRAAAALRKSS